MRVQCAWCKKFEKDKPPYDDDSISHGICPACREKYFPVKKNPQRARSNPAQRWYRCFLEAEDKKWGSRAEFDAHLRSRHGITEIHEVPGTPDQVGAIYYASRQHPAPMIGNSYAAPGVCDFCSDHPVVARYPCADFTVVPLRPSDMAIGPLSASRGDWAACRACYGLIEAEDYARLTKRAMRRFNLSPAVAPAMRAFHEGFRTHRTGLPSVFLDPRSRN
jgi:hypothetical protein